MFAALSGYTFPIPMCLHLIVWLLVLTSSLSCAADTCTDGECDDTTVLPGVNKPGMLSITCTADSCFGPPCLCAVAMAADPFALTDFGPAFESQPGQAFTVVANN